MNENKDIIYLEEKPIIEFPTLVRILLILMFFCIGLSFLFLPPPIVFLLFVGLCVSIAIFMNLYIGIIVFLVGMLFHPTRWFPQLQAYHPALLLALGVLFIWGFHILIFRDFRLIKVPQNFFILVFMALVFVSSLRNFDYIFSYFLDFSAKALILYFAISNLVRTKNQIVGLVWTLIVLNVILCLIGFYQYAHGIGEVYAKEGILRIRALAEESNYFAMDLTIAISLAFGLFYGHKGRPILKIVIIGAIFLFALTTIFTFSRAGFIQLVVVFILSFWLRVFKKNKVLAILIGLILFFALVPLVPQKYWARTSTIMNFQDPSIQRRLTGWTSGIGMMFQHPVKGVGFGVFRFGFLEYAYEKGYLGQTYFNEPLDAHNIYIQTGAELGVFGLILLLLLIIWTFKYLRKATIIFREKDAILLSEISSALQVSLWVYLIASSLLSLLHLLIFWMLIPLGVAMYRLALTYEGQKA